MKLIRNSQGEPVVQNSPEEKAQKIALATYLNEWPESMQFDTILEELCAAGFGAWVEVTNGKITIAQYYEDWNLAELAVYIARLADAIEAEFSDSSA